MSLRVIPCFNRDDCVGAILSNRADIAIYNEWQVGVTFFVTRFGQTIPPAVQSLPDFRKIGELQKVIGHKVDWYTLNRTREEVLQAFDAC
ncbi:MAG: hypothetical protein KBC35_01195 [Candidatus Pacebacteria bacterium]|nr:hypothetical protein [Candidatus Paceibacterota bacterium]